MAMTRIRTTIRGVCVGGFLVVLLLLGCFEGDWLRAGTPARGRNVQHPRQLGDGAHGGAHLGSSLFVGGIDTSGSAGLVVRGSGNDKPQSPSGAGSVSEHDTPDEHAEHAADVSKHHQECLARGEKLFPLFDKSDSPASQFQEYDDLARYGWKLTGKPKFIVNGRWKKASQDLRISRNSRDWVWLKFKHSGESKDPKTGITYPATDVHYDVAVNPTGAMMIVLDIFSPLRVRAKDAKDIVPLHRFSDIAWLIWKEQCREANVNPASLRYVFHAHINSPPTLDAVEEVAHMDPWIIPNYPGDLYRGESQAVKALVGTPNGLGAAYLLIDHKKELGPRGRVQSVRMWTSNHIMQMLFELGQGTGTVAGAKRPASDDSDPDDVRLPPGRRPQGASRRFLPGN